LNSGRKAEALRWAEEVHRRNLSSSAFYNLGTVYSKLGDYPNAIECYRRALARYGFNAGAYFNLGLACVKTQDFAGARESFEGFLRTWSGDVDSPYVQEARRQLQELAGGK
jgi:tetratricopeptide (TPR) repeat protein